MIIIMIMDPKVQNIILIYLNNVKRKKLNIILNYDYTCFFKFIV
jgi:hypothetical protein